MKKNIIIGVLSATIIIMALFSILQKSKAEEAMKAAIERAEMYQMEADHARIMAEHQAMEAKRAMEEAIIEAEKNNTK